VHLLGGDEGKARLEVEPHLVPEHRPGAGAGAIALLRAGVDDALEEVEVLLHDPNVLVRDRPDR
jgi:hypothetical protein